MIGAVKSHKVRIRMIPTERKEKREASPNKMHGVDCKETIHECQDKNTCLDASFDPVVSAFDERDQTSMERKNAWETTVFCVS